MVTAWPSSKHLAGGHPPDAEQRLGQLGPAGADQARHADDLAGSHGERDRNAPGRRL